MFSCEFWEIPHNFIFKEPAQPAFTYSKLTIEPLEQVWNMSKVNNKDTNIFHTSF